MSEKDVIVVDDDTNDAVHQVMMIMNVDQERASHVLDICDHSVELAVAHLLSAQQNQQQQRPKQVKRSLFLTSASSKRICVENSDALSPLLQDCVARCRNEPFVDPDFPAAACSLDGRQRNRQDKIPRIKCHCGVPAAGRTVQSDGPNYGRFYLVCGRVQHRRARVTVVRDDKQDEISATTTQNPYAKKPPSSPPQSRQKCNFFQWDNDGSKGYLGSRYNAMAWHRFGIDTGCTLFQKTMDPSQVRQGAVGNCWFLSALAVVAEKPHLVQRIVPHADLNDVGCYQINLCLDGQWIPMIVDSSLPVVYDESKPRLSPAHQQSKRSFRGGVFDADLNLTAYPAFCAVPQGQLWPALVEKAYAKAHGSYAALSGGFIAEGLTDLTGAPTETIVFDSTDRDELWVRLLSFVQAGFVMGVATARGGDGLVGGHAYSVMDGLEVHDVVVGEQSKVTDFLPGAKRDLKPGRTTERLVRLRNPWGKREWRGDWSVDSDRWTRALRKRLGDTTFAKGDGTFFMAYDDMPQRFHHMDVAKAREVRRLWLESVACRLPLTTWPQGWVHSSLPGSFGCDCDPLASSEFVYIFTPTERTWAFLSIVQPKKRANTQTLYWYCDPSILLLKKKPSEPDWTCEAAVLSGVSRSSHCEVFLDPEYSYVCIPLSHLAWIQGRFDFRFVMYSASAVAIESRSNSIAYQKEAMRLLHVELLRCGHKLLYPLGTSALLGCVHGQGCLYFVAINGATDSFLSLKLTIEEVDGLLVFGKVDDTYDVPPRSQRILVVLSRDGKHSATSQLNFRYLSSVMRANRGDDYSADIWTRYVKLGASLPLSLSGDLLTSGIQARSVQAAGGDTIDTYLWIPQVGAA